MKIGAVVLAAGASTRLGRPKQLMELDGETLLRRVARVALAVADPVVVVLGPDPRPFLPQLQGMNVTAVANPDAAEGMASSLRLGLATLPATDGALILTVDQWALTQRHLAQLVRAFRDDPFRPAAAAYAGTVGVPAILPRGCFLQAQALQGDRGAKSLLGAAQRVELPEAAFDLDRPQDIHCKTRSGSTR